MKEQWMVYTKKADFAGIAERFGISPVTARIMRNRDVEGDEAVRLFLHGKLEDCHDPELLKDMEKAADILLDKLLSFLSVFSFCICQVFD